MDSIDKAEITSSLKDIVALLHNIASSLDSMANDTFALATTVPSTLHSMKYFSEQFHKHVEPLIKDTGDEIDEEAEGQLDEEAEQQNEAIEESNDY